MFSVTTFASQPVPPRWRDWKEGRPFRVRGDEPFYGASAATLARLFHAVASDARTSHTSAAGGRAERVRLEAHEALRELYDAGHMTRRDFSVRMAWALYADQKFTAERTRAWEMQVADVKRLDGLREEIDRRMDRGLNVSSQKRSFHILMLKCAHQYSLSPHLGYPMYRDASPPRGPRRRRRRSRTTSRVNELRCRLARRGMSARQIAFIELMWLVPFRVERRAGSLAAVPCPAGSVPVDRIRARFTALVDAIEKAIKSARKKGRPGVPSPAR